MSLVSVIIPVFNKVAFIKETLDSALAQTYPHIELVVVNDGSTDGSFEILKKYAIEHPQKVKLIDSINKGVSAAINLGIKKSQGEYIQFLDADDLMSSDKLERQINLLKGRGSNVVASCEWVNFKNNNNQFTQLPYGLFQDFESGLDLLLRIWNYQEMHQPAVYLTHRDLIDKAGPWDESLSINQDGEFFCRVLLHAKQVLFEPSGKVFYRKPSENNVSQQKTEKAMASQLASLQLYERYVLNVEDSRRVRVALKKVYQKFIYDVYPNHLHLLKESEQIQVKLGIKEKVFIGGPKFQLISKILGFKIALKLKRSLKF
ncbi:MAG: glycosyltransferase family 2 protein [Mongoliitalea sp.]